jgi:hypothetical protein
VPTWVPATSEAFVQTNRYLVSRKNFRVTDPLCCPIRGSVIQPPKVVQGWR